MSKTEFISCPGCGRTLYNLQNTIAEIKAATSHLKGLKVGIMGCIVNGPGEMADADYGYVGAAPGKIDLYKGQECIKKGVPQAQAVEHLIDLISQEEQATIGFEIGNFSLRYPVVDGFLLHLEELRHVNNVEVLCPKGRMNPELLLLPLQAE